MRTLEDFKKLEAEGAAIITERRDFTASELLLLLKSYLDPLELIKVCYYTGVVMGYRQAKAEKKPKSTNKRTSKNN